MGLGTETIIFDEQLRKLDASDTTKALKRIYDHVRYIQDTLEWQLQNLDGRNINNIDGVQINIEGLELTGDVDWDMGVWDEV